MSVAEGHLTQARHVDAGPATQWQFGLTFVQSVMGGTGHVLTLSIVGPGEPQAATISASANNTRRMWSSVFCFAQSACGVVIQSACSTLASRQGPPSVKATDERLHEAGGAAANP